MTWLKIYKQDAAINTDAIQMVRMVPRRSGIDAQISHYDVLAYLSPVDEVTILRSEEETEARAYLSALVTKLRKQSGEEFLDVL